MKYKVTLSTVASITVTVDVEDDDDEAAIDKAYEVAREFSDQYLAGPNWTVGVNDEWQYEDPTVEPA